MEILCHGNLKLTILATHWPVTAHPPVMSSFISRVYSLNQDFSFAKPETKLQMCRLYNTAFYGSNCWEFATEQVEKFAKTWNVNLRIMYDLPFDTHCWIVEELSGGKHFLQMIFSRFVKYLKVLKNNKRLFIRNLFSSVSGDVQSPTGSNVKQIIKNWLVSKMCTTTQVL